MNQTLRDKYMAQLDAQGIPVEYREDMAEFVFANLPAFINRHFDSSFNDIESRLEPSYFDSIREKVFTNPAAKRENEATDSKYTRALKQWSRLLSTLRNSRKAQLSGAEKSSKNEGKTKEPKPIQMADPLCPEDNESQTEGRLRQVSLTQHERNRRLREACLRHYAQVLHKPYTCAVCGMNFEKIYGEIGRDFIEVHHLMPIASSQEEHEVDPTKDLVPLCSNCHSMIHRGGKEGKPLKLEELISIYIDHAKTD